MLNGSRIYFNLGILLNCVLRSNKCKFLQLTKNSNLNFFRLDRYTSKKNKNKPLGHRKKALHNLIDDLFTEYLLFFSEDFTNKPRQE